MYFFLEIVIYIAVVVVAIQIIRLCFADADLTLMNYVMFGNSTDKFTGKVIWITGASTGIGRSLALELAKVPCKLVLSARRENELQNVKQRCLELAKLKEDDVLVLPIDLLDTKTDLKLQVNKVLSHFGKVDVLINNAGRSQRAKFENVDIEVDREVFQLNVFSAVELTTALLPHFMERKQGHVVAISSLAGKTSVPGSRSYTGSKHAMQGYFECLRMEMVPYNIDVTMVCPGPVYSDLLKVAFTEKQGELFGKDFLPNDNRMTSERCAYLTLIAIANKLDEAWVCNQPVLLMFYASQYLPSITRWFMMKVGAKKMLEIRDGQQTMDMNPK